MYMKSILEPIKIDGSSLNIYTFNWFLKDLHLIFPKYFKSKSYF